MEKKKLRVTIWHEYGAEKLHEVVSRLYPEGQHKALADMLMQETGDFDITAAELSQPELGLPDSMLENTDVLIWWSHFRHDMVPDELCDKRTACCAKEWALLPCIRRMEQSPLTALSARRAR